MEQRAYEAKIKGIWVRCGSIEELEELLDRFGSEGDTDEPLTNGGSRRVSGAGTTVQGSALDAALLKELAAAGTAGVKTKRIEGMVGSKGRGLHDALQKWAVRMKVAPDERTFPFQTTRVDGARGWRLTDGALLGAKHIVEGKHA